MFVQLRTRLLASSTVTIAIVVGLIAFVLFERFDLNRQAQTLVQLKNAAGLARELSLYVQYSAHDTNAYTLGHLEHRDEFREHAAAFGAVLTELQQQRDAGVLGADFQATLNQIAQLRARYDAASLALFEAADKNRESPTPANQARTDQTWEASDVLGDQVDSASQQLADTINADVERAQRSLAERNRQVTGLLIGFGLLAAVVVSLLQLSSARAVGRPIVALLDGVRRFAAGALDTRVPVRRRDEVGNLTEAFNDMAATIEQQTVALHAQTSAAEVARAEAEQARAGLTEQLATIEQQRIAIREMSVPILPVTTTTLVMPLIGALDSERLQIIQEQALRAVSETRGRHLILDVTGVPVVDSQVAQGLIQVVQAARLLGAEVVVAGIRPEVAQTIVGLGIDLSSVITQSSLQSSITFATTREQSGRALVERS